MGAGKSTPLHLGVAYYPEHWPEDMRLMGEAGLILPPASQRLRPFSVAVSALCLAPVP
jgi:hypothetical protein